MDALVRLRVLGAQLDMPVDWLRDAALSGLIPALRIENRLYFNPDAVTRTLAALAGRGTASLPSGTRVEGE